MNMAHTGSAAAGFHTMRFKPDGTLLTMGADCPEEEGKWMGS
jgi:hypothetical protein